jgi:Large polyvalent protein-associated domain 11
MSNSLENFEYQLLGRLQQDCEYYLGAGARNAKHLWALDVSLQIQKMKELHEKLSIKPEWLSMEEINRYEQKMSGSPVNTEQPQG